MENLEGVSMTELDALVSDNKMQMLKAALPYISATQQQVLSIYVKVLELNNTIQLVHREESRKVGICSVSEQKRNTTEMLNTIKRYCTDAEKEMIDLFMNFFSAFRMYNTYQELMPKENTKEPRVQKEQKEGINPMEALKSMLSPEQKSMLDTYSTLLSSIK